MGCYPSVHRLKYLPPTWAEGSPGHLRACHLRNATRKRFFSRIGAKDFYLGKGSFPFAQKGQSLGSRLTLSQDGFQFFNPLPKLPVF